MTHIPDTNRLRQLLIGYAQQRSTLDYKSLTHELGFRPPNSIAQSTALLEACQEDDALLGLPQLVAVIIQKRGARCPRPGFFQKLTQLGVYQGQDSGAAAQMWHQNELERVYRHYQLNDATALD
ncbi:hypothetical protein [Reinekea sp.]|jgi:hypothetical protein|uniref:hypothetical protein n=1 Tax=Reinekea sp. TaxID=1970455 RepID=UPI002A815148|nr:hypothetical protein [Reinekea sp.]